MMILQNSWVIALTFPTVMPPLDAMLYCTSPVSQNLLPDTANVRTLYICWLNVSMQ
jgi:hypothetical protein